MRYYKHLYLTEGLEKKKEKIIRKLESGKLQPSVHVITLRRTIGYLGRKSRSACY